jgi:hypothetical protein
MSARRWSASWQKQSRSRGAADINVKCCRRKVRSREVLPSEGQIPGGGGVAAITTACPLGVAAPTTGRPRLSNSQTAVPIAPTANSTAPTTMDQRFILRPLTKTSRSHPATNIATTRTSRTAEKRYTHIARAKTPTSTVPRLTRGYSGPISRHGEVWSIAAG